MATTVSIPGVGDVDFPDSMSPQEIKVQAQAIQAGKVKYRSATPTPAPTALAQTRGEEYDFGPMVRRAALPTIGGAIGGAIGGLAATPSVLGVPAGVLGGEAVGSAAGEGLNQIFGIGGSQPSATGLAEAAAGPGVGRAVGGAVKGLLSGAMRYLPGGGVGLQEAGARRMEDLVKSFRPDVDLDQLGSVVKQFNVQIPMAKMASTLDDMITHERNLTKGATQDTSVLRMAQALRDKINAGGGSLDFQDIRNEVSRLGAMTGIAARKGETTQSEAAKRIFAAARDDFDAAVAQGQPGRPAVEALKEFNQAWRKTQAADELQDAMLNKGVIRTRDDGLREIHVQRMQELLRKDKFLRESLSPQDLAEVTAVVDKLRGIPILPPQAGQQFGAGQTAVRGAIGYVAGSGLGLEPGTAAAIAGAAPWIISRAMMTKPGRALVLKIIEERGVLDHASLAVLGAAVGAQGPAQGAFGQ